MHYIKSNKMQMTLATNTNVANIVNSISFAGVKFYDPIASSLQRLGISQATDIQQASIGPLLTGLSAICHSETGSGKSLCYLLPLLKRLTTTETIISHSNNVQAIIIVPSKELAVQVSLHIL